MEGVAVLSPGKESHDSHLDAAVKGIHKSQPAVEMSKCELFQSSCSFSESTVLGARHVMPPSKESGVRDGKTPATAPQTQGSLGACKSLKKGSLPKSETAAPMHPASREHLPVWNPPWDTIFQEVRSIAPSPATVPFTPMAPSITGSDLDKMDLDQGRIQAGTALDGR
ncbi:hypothetical protein DSO57_1027141 [Entomophthora muscae]|uniref:Uncharacterized protein n=1 Tax=Entomophthora muscae TaxID=34485 RepID=A0ACC2RGI0_9FUNG|nr:hypothetical protein DSO57_1027141 [Entomophthora muscae]